MEFETITRSLLVRQKGDPIYSTTVTEIRLEDEASGLFLAIVQYPDEGTQTIRLCKEEWLFVRDAVENLMKMC